MLARSGNLTALRRPVSIGPYTRAFAIPLILAPRIQGEEVQLSVIIAIVIAIAGVLFAVQNSVPSTIVFFLWRFDGSLGVILLLAAALGGLIVALVSTPTTLRSNWAIRRQQKEIDGLKTANAELRARAAELERRSASGGSGSAQIQGH